MINNAFDEKVSDKSNYSSDGSASGEQNMTMYELFAVHNTNFYHRFKKFFNGFSMIASASESCSTINSTNDYYEKMKVTLALPGIRPRGQKLEKVVADDKVVEFIEGKDKLFVAEFAPTLWEDYNYLFIDKYPELDPLHKLLIKHNKLCTFVPTSQKRFILMAKSGQYKIDFINENSGIDLYQIIETKHNHFLEDLVYLSMYPLVKQTASQKQNLTTKGLEWLINHSKGFEDFLKITFGNDL